MATLAQKRYSFAAEIHGLLVSEFDGQVTGIGTRDELQQLLDDGILPVGTTLRDAKPEDF